MKAVFIICLFALSLANQALAEPILDQTYDCQFGQTTIKIYQVTGDPSTEFVAEIRTDGIFERTVPVSQQHDIPVSTSFIGKDLAVRILWKHSPDGRKRQQSFFNYGDANEIKGFCQTAENVY